MKKELYNTYSCPASNLHEVTVLKSYINLQHPNNMGYKINVLIDIV